MRHVAVTKKKHQGKPGRPPLVRVECVFLDAIHFWATTIELSGISSVPALLVAVS
jgi:hypothetical protein